MTLHYIWIKTFRNLQDQHVNLTGKYLLTFRTSEIIEVQSIDQPLPTTFWGKNIESFNAIIGENGTGKTNLLVAIMQLLFYPKSFGSEFIILYSDDRSESAGGINAYHSESIERKEIQGIFKLNRYNAKTEELNHDFFRCVFFTNVFENTRNYVPKKVIDLKTNANQLYNYYRETNVINELEFFQNSKFSKKLRICPTNILVKLPINNKSVTGEREPFKSIRSKLANRENNQNLYYWLLYFVLTDIIDVLVPNSLNLPYGKGSEIDGVIERLPLKFSKDTNIHIVMKEISDFLKSNPVIEGKKFELNQLVEAFEQVQQNEKLEYFVSGKRVLREHSFIVQYSPHFQSIIKKYHSFFLTGSKLTFSWIGLSSGQKAFLQLFSKISSIKKKIRKLPTLILIDEGDLYFHPQWQKEFISMLLEFVQDELPDAKLQIIVTSHSPLIASDVPKSNIVFLRTENQSEPQYQTFAANIHELLADSFFIKNGLIGDFALQKINETFDKIEKREDSENVRKVIKIVGEPFIKTSLIHKFNSVFPIKYNEQDN